MKVTTETGRERVNWCCLGENISWTRKGQERLAYLTWVNKEGKPSWGQKREARTSLVVQWLRLVLPLQGARIQSLVREVPNAAWCGQKGKKKRGLGGHKSCRPGRPSDGGWFLYRWWDENPREDCEQRSDLVWSEPTVKDPSGFCAENSLQRL